MLELIDTIKCLMVFLKIHTDERDVGFIYGVMRRLVEKKKWNYEDEAKAQQIMEKAHVKIQEIKERRRYNF